MNGLQLFGLGFLLGSLLMLLAERRLSYKYQKGKPLVSLSMSIFIFGLIVVVLFFVVTWEPFPKQEVTPDLPPEQPPSTRRQLATKARIHRNAKADTEKALTRLRSAVTVALAEGMSISEVAEVCEVSVSTVRRWKFSVAEILSTDTDIDIFDR